MPASHPVRQLPFLAPGELMVAGKQVGIAGLDSAFAAVQARGLSGDAEIGTELMRRVTENNYVPPALADEYATAVLTEYKKATEKSHGLP